MSKDDPVYQYCKENGVVRVEVELKRRLLQAEGLDRIENITQHKLEEIYEQETEIFRRVDRSDEPDILDALPARYRMTAAAWLSGEDVRSFMTNGTLYRHAKVLRDYGIDIMEPRNLLKFPVKVNVINLQPLSPPDWYEFDDRFDEVEPLKLVVNK